MNRLLDTAVVSVAAWALLVSTAVMAQEDGGRSYLAEGATDAAAQHYSSALAVNPFDAVALNNLAVAKAAAGDYQSARELLQRAARMAPTRNDIASNLIKLQDWMDHERDQIAPATTSPLRGDVSRRTVPPEPPALWGSSRATSAVSSARSALRD